MSYTMPGAYRTLGSLGDEPNTFRVRPVPAGDEVALRFRGTGVTRSNARPVFDAIRVAVLETGHFKEPKRLDWGPGGTLSFLGEVKSSNYTLPQIADFMVGVARKISQRTGKQITFFNAKHEDWEMGATGGGTAAAIGSVTAAQRSLRARAATIRTRITNIFGTQDFSPISMRDIGRIAAREVFSGPATQAAVLLRSVLVVSAVWATERLVVADTMIEGVRQNVPGAMRDATDEHEYISSGLASVESLLSALESAISRFHGSQGATSGLGELTTAAIAGICAAVVAAAGTMYIIYKLVEWYFKPSAAERAEDYCKRQLAATGQRCTAQQMREATQDYMRQDATEEAESFWGKFVGTAGTGLGIVVTALVVGLGGWAAFQAYQFYKTSRATGRLALGSRERPRLPASSASQA